MHNLVNSRNEFVNEIDFLDTRYMGSKRKLLPELNNIFEQLNFHTALDAFSGTSSVAYLLKLMGKKVDTNDYLQFNYHIAKGLIENSHQKITEDEIQELILKNKEADNFIEKEFTDIYYSKNDCKWLDSTYANIQFLDNEYKKSLALAALCRACIKKRPRGIFTYTGMRYDDGRKDLTKSMESHFIDAINGLNSSVINTKEKGKAFNRDIMSFEKFKYDLVYFDPPYFSLKSDNEYSRRYHFLEGLVSYWSHVTINRDTKTKKFDRPNSPFTHKHSVEGAFEELFYKAKNSHIVLSYSSNCFPNAPAIKSMLRNAGKSVELIKIDYKYSVGTHAHKKNNESNSVQEYVFLGI